VLPGTHALIIEEAAARVGAVWPCTQLGELIAGCEDEDVHIVPVLRLRLRAFGLTHTERPGSTRGELGATSAGRRCEIYFRQATERGPGAEAARLLGRACHLLGDAAVPARARGVWHFRGDPLESYLERAGRAALVAGPAPEPPFVGAAALCARLAGLAAAHEADTTRTPWGEALHRRWGVGRALGDEEIERQAGRVLPDAIAHTAALLRAASRR
jgi:hypothetical protein